MMRFNIETLVNLKANGSWETDKPGIDALVCYVDNHRSKYPEMNRVPNGDVLAKEIFRGLGLMVHAMNQLNRRNDPLFPSLSPANWEITIGHERFSDHLKVVNSERRHDKQKPVHHYITAIAVSEIIGDTMPIIELPTRGKTDVETKQHHRSAKILPFRAGSEERADR